MSAEKLPPMPKPDIAQHTQEVWIDDVRCTRQLGPRYTADQMRAYALQARAQVQGEPVYWEWRHLSTHPNTVDFGQWSEWQRVEARNPIFTAEDALAEFRTYIAQGYKYELRALYTTPQPAQATQAASAEDMKVYDSIADRYFREATQAEVADEQIKEAAVKAVKDGKLSWLGFEKDDQDKYTIPVISKSHYQFARAILALRPQQSGLTGCNCRWDGDTQVQWCELHLAHKEAIHEWAERAKEAEKQLALRPERVPMTPASRDVIMATRTANADADEWPEPWSYQRGWNNAEAHHFGVTTKAKGDQ